MKKSKPCGSQTARSIIRTQMPTGVWYDWRHRCARFVDDYCFRLPPLLEHAGLLPDCQPDPRPMLDRLGEDLARLIQVAAGVEHALEPAFLNLLLDLVVVAMVRQQRLVGFFVGPICSWLHLSQSLARYT